MESKEDERPDAAVEAAAALDAEPEKTIVGIGEYVAYYNPQTDADADGDGDCQTISVCRVIGLDHCNSSDRSMLHSDVLFEVESGAAELQIEQDEQRNEAPA